jgi:hypothetical protein
LQRVRNEIDAMERCGAVGAILDEARQHARDLEAILADGGVRASWTSRGGSL